MTAQHSWVLGVVLGVVVELGVHLSVRISRKSRIQKLNTKLHMLR